jgi:hypothetical protein
MPGGCSTGVACGTPPGIERLPAPGAPFFQVRPLRAERRVAAVAGVDSSRVGQSPENPLFEPTHQAIEVLRACCPPRTAREQARTGR